MTFLNSARSGFGPLFTTKNPETKTAKDTALIHHLKWELFFNSFTVMKMGRIYRPILTALPEKKRRPNLLWLPGLLLTILICGLVSGTKAQSVWNRTYVEDRPIMLFSSVQADVEGYTVTGGSYGYINNLGKGLIARLGVDGNIVRYKIFVDSVYESYATITNSLVNTSSSKVAFCGYSYTNLAYLLFCMADKETDSIKIYRYYTPNTFAYQGYQVAYADDNFYVTGVRTDSSTNNPNVCFIKIDTNGNRLFERNYGTSWYEQASSVSPLTNGNLIIGGVRSNLNLNPTVQKANTWLLEVDTGGNVVRQWFDPNDSTYVAEGLRQTQDGGFIYGAQKKGEQTVNDVYKTATIVKLDSNFNKQWIFNGGSISSYTTITDIEELPDGSIIACGNKPFYQTDSNTVSGWIIKLTANGSVVWERVYRGINQTQTLNLLTDIDILPDGGLIAVGQCQLSGATPPQVGWFLKLDSNGCEVENCLVGIEDHPQHTQGGLNSQIQIQPNPATSQVTISVNESPAFLTVSDVTGRQFLAQQLTDLNNTIDIRHLPNGVYLLAVETKGSKVVKHLVKQ